MYADLLSKKFCVSLCKTKTHIEVYFRKHWFAKFLFLSSNQNTISTGLIYSVSASDGQHQFQKAKQVLGLTSNRTKGNSMRLFQNLCCLYWVIPAVIVGYDYADL